MRTTALRTLFHSLVYLVLGVWLGALVFFGAILAPIAFSQLPPLFPNPAAGIHAAGMVVGSSLVRLHWMGLFCGLIFLAVLILARTHYRAIIPQAVLVLVMMALTAYSQFSIIPITAPALPYAMSSNISLISPGVSARARMARVARAASRSRV